MNTAPLGGGEATSRAALGGNASNRSVADATSLLSSSTATAPRGSPVAHASTSAIAAQAATSSRRIFTRGNLAHRRWRRRFWIVDRRSVAADPDRSGHAVAANRLIREIRDPGDVGPRRHRDAVRRGEADKVRRRPHRKLAVHVGAMGLDGLDADAQAPSDILARRPRDDQPEDLDLA